MVEITIFAGLFQLILVGRLSDLGLQCESEQPFKFLPMDQRVGLTQSNRSKHHGNANKQPHRTLGVKTALFCLG